MRRCKKGFSKKLAQRKVDRCRKRYQRALSKKFADRTVDGLRKASRSGMVDNEELLRRLNTAMLVIHERSKDPGARILANFAIREMPAFRVGEQAEGRFRITYEFCAVRNQDEEGNSNLGLDTDDILRLVAEIESVEDFQNPPFAETALSESEVLP